MAATMKHRRSSSKRDKARGSNRYDKTLTKFKKMKKKGGRFVSKRIDGKTIVSHRVTAENPVYKNTKILQTKE